MKKVKRKANLKIGLKPNTNTKATTDGKAKMEVMVGKKRRNDAGNRAVVDTAREQAEARP